MKINFITSNGDPNFLTIDPPVPSKNNIPQWYKDIPRFLSKDKKIEIGNGQILNNSVKACLPFLDAISHGYIQKTWCDIYIEDLGETLQYHYSRSPEIISYRENGPSIKISNDFYQMEMIWKVYWMPKMPKGWSILFTHPLNRIDLPFQSLSAIVDSDHFHHIFPGNYPFFIKKGFTGLIPAGTPMYQMIPIKRESWHSGFEYISEQERIVKQSKMTTHLFSRYKKLFHQKKHFD